MPARKKLVAKKLLFGGKSLTHEDRVRRWLLSAYFKNPKKLKQFTPKDLAETLSTRGTKGKEISVERVKRVVRKLNEQNIKISLKKRKSSPTGRAMKYIQNLVTNGTVNEHSVAGIALYLKVKEKAVTDAIFRLKKSNPKIKINLKKGPFSQKRIAIQVIERLMKKGTIEMYSVANIAKIATDLAERRKGKVRIVSISAVNEAIKFLRSKGIEANVKDSIYKKKKK